MNKSLFNKSALIAGFCAIALAGQVSAAVDVAEAASVMAEVESMSVSAKANLAKAAAAGDTDAVAEAKKRSDAIDVAVASARNAFSQLETNVQNGDMDAAETAQDELAAALVQVRDALMGAIPETMVAEQQGEAAEEDAGEGNGGPQDPPNIYEVSWKSEGIKAYSQSLFGTFWESSAFGTQRGFGDLDATPE